MSGEKESESPPNADGRRNEDTPTTPPAPRCKFFRSLLKQVFLPTVLIVAAAYIIQRRGWCLVYSPDVELPGQGEMMFYAYDINRDGFIDKLEFQFLVTKLDANVGCSLSIVCESL